MRRRRWVSLRLARAPVRSGATATIAFPRPERLEIGPVLGGPVRPEALMAAIQEIVIDRHDAIVLAESGNSFTWANHYLRFNEAGRYRVSTNVGSMGHAGRRRRGRGAGAWRKAVAIIGDGAMLMNSEVNTAVKFDSAGHVDRAQRRPLQHVRAGDARALGSPADAGIPEVDFAMLARALGPMEPESSARRISRPPSREPWRHPAPSSSTSGSIRRAGLPRKAATAACWHR